MNENQHHFLKLYISRYAATIKRFGVWSLQGTKIVCNQQHCTHDAFLCVMQYSAPIEYIIIHNPHCVIPWQNP